MGWGGNSHQKERVRVEVVLIRETCRLEIVLDLGGCGEEKRETFLNDNQESNI